MIDCAFCAILYSCSVILPLVCKGLPLKLLDLWYIVLPAFPRLCIEYDQVVGLLFHSYDCHNLL